MKVGKEELAGLYAAVKCFLATDLEAAEAESMRQLSFIRDHASAAAHARKSKFVNGKLWMEGNEATLGMTVAEVEAALLGGDPSILLNGRRICM